MKKAYIGLGSNLDHPDMQIREALDRLGDTPGILVIQVSSLYQSKALGEEIQPDYLNAVVEIETNFSAEELLNFLQRIEDAQKRIRTENRWGPRTIDLDILLFGDDQIQTDRLQVPHPELSQREFVVYPLAEIAPNLRTPSGDSIAQLIAQCPQREIRRIGSLTTEAVE